MQSREKPEDIIEKFLIEPRSVLTLPLFINYTSTTMNEYAYLAVLVYALRRKVSPDVVRFTWNENIKASYDLIEKLCECLRDALIDNVVFEIPANVSRANMANLSDFIRRSNDNDDDGDDDDIRFEIEIDYLQSKLSSQSTSTSSNQSTSTSSSQNAAKKPKANSQSSLARFAISNNQQSRRQSDPDDSAVNKPKDPARKFEPM